VLLGDRHLALTQPEGGMNPLLIQAMEQGYKDTRIL
jgi:hypothetical protein